MAAPLEPHLHQIADGQRQLPGIGIGEHLTVPARL
jgi:hypothetical protein